MKHALSIATLSAATILLGATFANAQAPVPGRGDQSGGGAAEMSSKPMPAAAGPRGGTESPAGGNRLNDAPAQTQSAMPTNREETKGGMNAK